MPGSHYDTLRVTATATPFEIRQAYRRMIGQWHPHGWQQREQAFGDAMFRALSEALSVLSDPSTRALYDQGLAGGQPPGPMTALDSAGALAIFTREMHEYAEELGAQGLAPEDVVRYLASLGVPGGVARSLCGLAPVSVGPSASMPSRRRTLLLGLLILIVAVVAVLLFPPIASRTAPVAPSQAPDAARASNGPNPSNEPQPPTAPDSPEQRSAREFNRMMAEFEGRHPEFDPRSAKYDASAADALRRRIEVLERQGYDSPEALRQAMSEYERLLAARPGTEARTAAPPPGQTPARGPATGSGSASPVQAPPDGDALRTLCETFPHACRR